MRHDRDLPRLWLAFVLTVLLMACLSHMQSPEAETGLETIMMHRSFTFTILTPFALLASLLLAGCSNGSGTAPKTLQAIQVSPAGKSIPLGTQQQFTATGQYSDGSTQDLISSVSWSSSSTTVATISNTSGSTGLASSAALGNTTITATSGSISGSTTLNVTA